MQATDERTGNLDGEHTAMSKRHIHSCIVGDEQEISFDGKILYSGPVLALKDTIDILRHHFHVDLPAAMYSWKNAVTEEIR